MKRRLPFPRNRNLAVNLPRVENLQKSERFVLPGEVFQTQLETELV